MPAAAVALLLLLMGLVVSVLVRDVCNVVADRLPSRRVDDEWMDLGQRPGFVFDWLNGMRRV